MTTEKKAIESQLEWMAPLVPASEAQDVFFWKAFPISRLEPSWFNSMDTA